MADDGFTKIETGRKSEVHRGDDKIPRDHLGRYLLPEPGEDGSRARAWTRVTTLAGALKDRYGLERWDNRNIVWGIGQRPALWAQAAAAKLTDVKTLDQITDRAKEAADHKAGADLGSAIHTFAERVDRGEDLDIPEPFASDIAAYRKAQELAGITTAVGWIERVVVVPELHVPDAGVYGVVGTLDRVSNAMEWQLPRIGDIKSAADKERDGRVVDPIQTYGMDDIPLQLAMYAHGTHWWDIENETWVEMPMKLDQERAVVFHIPAGLGECRVWEIDIAAGWEAVQLALDIRRWRKRKDLGSLLISINSSGEIARAAQPEGDDGKNGPDAGTAAASGEASNRADVSGKGEPGGQGGSPSTRSGGEAVTPSAEDPPARPSSPPDPHEDIEEMAGVEAHDVARAIELYGDAGIPEYLTDQPGVTEPLADVDMERWTYALERVNAIKALDDPAPRRRLASLWSVFDAIPLFPNEANPDRTGPRTWAELSKVIGVLNLVEMEFTLPFPERSEPNPDEPLPSPSERRKAREQTYQDDQTAKRKVAAAKARTTRARNKAKGEK